MIKIFLVEDEVIIRNGIKNSIDWENNGYEFVGEASDGELAYPLILKTRPDILITDIKMPFMDGLELSEAVKKELPDIKILILSGYNDFEYAKRAISIGITDYLLKPISADKLLEALAEVSVKISKEREEKELLRKYAEDMQENTEHEKYLFFSRLITESVPITEALELGRRLDMNLSAELYNIMLLNIWENESVKEKKKEKREELSDAYVEVEDYVHSLKRVCCIRRGVEGWAFLCLADQEAQMADTIRDMRESLSGIMENYRTLEYFGGIGEQVDRLRNLSSSFREAQKSFASRFTMENNQIVSQQDVHRVTEEEAPEARGLGVVKDNRELVTKFLRNGTEEEVSSFLEVLFSAEARNNLRSMLMRQYIMMDIYISVITFGEGLNISTEDIQKVCGEMKDVAEYVVSEDKMRIYTEKLVHEMIILRDEASGKRYSDIIEAAQAYILGNYMSENISLNSVAASVGMSPSYFSSIFSQEVGRTFVEYLTGIRMEKAKELLMCSSKKTSEIGFEVGYKDAHYFSYIFKKTQQCSPKEYRTRRKL